jgi:[ribosomal protein S5]-alanine N-acetyltransferase
MIGVMPQPELHTERLCLRAFRTEDVADASTYRNDADFVRFLRHVPHPFTRADAEAFVALNMSEDWQQSPTFAVVLDGKLIGTINLEVDRPTRTAMLGYAIGRAWWGQGLAVEAARSVLEWAAAEFELTRIWASTDARNTRSRRVLEKVGMHSETVRVGDHLGRDGQPVDEVVYHMNVEAPQPAR